ncbi:hypothetical protein BKA57DRAFT_450379 [Linnemannia elongata]|nr:hypothetical protein BKA57DRAFT_450379 [Linnemannia elongata]
MMAMTRRRESTAREMRLWSLHWCLFLHFLLHLQSFQDLIQIRRQHQHPAAAVAVAEGSRPWTLVVVDSEVRRNFAHNYSYDSMKTWWSWSSGSIAAPRFSLQSLLSMMLMLQWFGRIHRGGPRQ